MAISKDKALCFQKDGTTYTYYGYTTPPSGHYIGFRSGGVTRYIPLANNTNGELKVRIAGGTYSVARQTSTIRLQVQLFNRQTAFPNVRSLGEVTVQSTGTLSNTFSQNITVTVEAKLGTSQNSRSYTVSAGSSSFGSQGQVITLSTVYNNLYATQARLKITAFGQTFYSDWATLNGSSLGTYSNFTLSATVSI